MARISREDRQAAKEAAAKEVKKGIRNSVFSFLFTNPAGWIIIVLIVAMIAYTLYSVDYQLKQILKQYTSLSARRTSSGAGFDRRLFYITTDQNGNQVIHVGYSSEVQEEAARQAQEEAGGSVGPALSEDAEVIRAKLAASSKYKAKADSMAAIYDIVVNKLGLSKELAVGFMINSAHEGNYGVVQYGKTVPNWDGSSSATSYANNPLIVSTAANIAALEALCVEGNSVGCGIVQWTYYTRLKRLCEHYRANLNGSTISRDGLIRAENSWFEAEVNSYRDSIEKTAASSSYTAGSAEAYAYAVCVEFEKPKNKYASAATRASKVAELLSVIGD